MIIESIVSWFFGVFSFAVSLLPSVGNTFANVPKLSFSFLKDISVVNGYIPIVEIGQSFVIMIAIWGSMQVVLLVMGVYNYVTKAIP